VWANVPNGTRADMVKAIDAAQEAFKPWAALPYTKRSAIMNKVADIMDRRQMDFVKAVTEEIGGWFGKGMYESGYTAGVYRAAAAANYESIGEIPPSVYGKLSMAIRSPMGVIGVISPWNFPMILSSRGFAFAMAAGNTIVLKPSEDSPVVGGTMFAEVLEEAGVPPGVFNVVTCSRENVVDVGEELITNPKVKGISFTGSTAVGRMIGAKAGNLLKKCCLELGGKDALLILDDADMDRAVDAATFGSFMHQGQICMSVERILVDKKIADEFTQRFVEKTKKLGMGVTSIENKGNIIGPIINEKQASNIRNQIKEALAKGAKALTGGPGEGLFIPPTILTNVKTDMSVWKDETFGPVAPIMVVNNEDEAIALANDSEYGLSAGIITNDDERGLRVASRLETGMAHINCSSVNDEPVVPFGGAKASGLGRHGGRWAVEAFTETRWITVERGGRHYPF
jgi:aldehyde dehydrogenase (NAD+)